MSRRLLLGSAVAFGTGTIAAGVAEAGACDTMTVWQLSADWDEPRGPNGKTRLISRASRRAARHRYALSAADAQDMNLHLGSFAPAVPRIVRRVEFMAVWNAVSYDWTNPWNSRVVRLLDSRHAVRLRRGEALLERALDTEAQRCEAAPLGDGVPDSTVPVPSQLTSGPVMRPGQARRPGVSPVLDTFGRGAPAARTGSAGADQGTAHLASTGAGIVGTTVAGIGVLVAGLVARRGRLARAERSTSERTDETAS